MSTPPPDSEAQTRSPKPSRPATPTPAVLSPSFAAWQAKMQAEPPISSA